MAEVLAFMAAAAVVVWILWAATRDGGFRQTYVVENQGLGWPRPESTLSDDKAYTAHTRESL